MFQQAPRKERSRSAVFSAPANMLSIRNAGGSSNVNNNSSSSQSTPPQQEQVNMLNRNSGAGLPSGTTSTPSKHSHTGHGHQGFGSYIPTSAAIPQPLPGPSEQWYTDSANPQQDTPSHHLKNASDHTRHLSPNYNPTLKQGVPQSNKPPSDPSNAPGVSFRSSLKPHQNAVIPDIPYGSGQGQGQRQTKKRSVSIASSAAPSTIATTNSTSGGGGGGGKARIFTPSDSHKGIRVTPESDKKTLAENTAHNAGSSGGHSKHDHHHVTASSSSSHSAAPPQTQLVLPSAPLTVNAPVVPSTPQVVTAIDTTGLENTLRDSSASASASGKQPPKSAMKARSWADLVRPMNNIQLAEHTVKNIGLPEERQTKDPAADAAMAQFQGDDNGIHDSPRKKKVHIALPSGVQEGQDDNSSITTATPHKTGVSATGEKSPKHDSPPPEPATQHAPKEHHHHHKDAAATTAAASDARSVKSGTSTHTHGSVLDSYVSKKTRLEEILHGVENSHSSVLLYPRGLVNTGNACFMNAILQALLFTAPFYNLISLIGANTSQDLSGKTPLLDAMVSYLSEFRATKDNGMLQDKESGLKSGEGYEDQPSAQYKEAFIPSIIYHALNHNHRFAQMGFYNPTSSASSSSLTNGGGSHSLSQFKGGNAPLTAGNLNANNRLSQEDAHEFLGFFLDTIHEELLIKIDQHDSLNWQKATKGLKAAQDTLARQSVNSIASLQNQPHMQQSSSGTHAQSHANASGSSVTNGHTGSSVHAPAAEGDDWLEVGQKGRTATTRTTEHQESAVTRIFGGQLRSVLRCPGQKDSVTLEPYTSLQLEIHQSGVTSITDALSLISTPETISDMTNKNKMPVEATKQVFIDTLPPVLILHLKRFNYDARAGQVVKSHKIISFDTEFEIPKDCLAPAKRNSLNESKKTRYRLTGVVYHHGKSAAGGHYSCAMRQNNGRWINIDDTHITSTTAEEVATDHDRETMRLSLPSATNLRGIPEKTAYLLFYQRI